MDHWDEDAPTFVSMRRATGLRADQSKNASKFGKVQESMGRIQLAVTEAGDPAYREMAVHMLEKRARRAMQLAGIDVSITRTAKKLKFPRILEASKATPDTTPRYIYHSDNGEGHLDALDMSPEELVDARTIHRVEQLRIRFERVCQMSAAHTLTEELDTHSPTIPNFHKDTSGEVVSTSTIIDHRWEDVLPENVVELDID